MKSTIPAAMFVSAIWCLLAFAMPIAYQLGDFPDSWLAPLRSYWSENTSLGETGDFLTGWLTPLALMWFIITVSLQKHELSLQRLEFEKLREEYQENRIAAQEQATQLKKSNLVRKRQLFRERILDEIAMIHRNCEHVRSAYNKIADKEKTGKLTIEGLGKPEREESLCRAIYELFDSIAQKSKTSSYVSFEKIVEIDRNDKKNELRKHLRSISSRYNILWERACEVSSLDDFQAFCAYRIEGEILALGNKIIDDIDTYEARQELARVEQESALSVSA